MAYIVELAITANPGEFDTGSGWAGSAPIDDLSSQYLPVAVKKHQDGTTEPLGPDDR